LGEGDVCMLSQHVSLHPGEYSYFSPRTLSMWAGPEHWRFHRHPSVPGPEKASRQRIPKKAFELDFEADIDFEAYFRKTKAPTTLAKSTLESQNIRSTTLPADFNYDPQNLTQLFLKPHVRVSQSSDPVVTLDNEAGIEDYDYDNPNDTSNFCPALQVSDSDDDPDPVEFLGQAEQFQLPAHPEAPECSEINRGNIPACGELELIAEPPKIHKTAIQYARTAKRVDMRRLKRNMWELLTEQGEVSKGNSSWEFCNTELCPIPAPLDSWMLWDSRALIPILLFHRLPPAMAADLSVPVAFLSLLHVASEKNLTLESTKDLSDVVVKPGD
ncbi:CND2 protein, partial [Leptocoma aspasia]|nr:CND2 protein [Leptocoma aspasia]